MSASAPSTTVTTIPGRFSPLLVTDKRGPATIATSTTTQIQQAYLTRAETASQDFNIPVTEIDELGNTLLVGFIDDIPENKIPLSIYDCSMNNMSLLTAKSIANPGTTTIQFMDLNLAVVDIVRQYASPDGKIFGSAWAGDHVIEEASFSYKKKAAAMEQYNLCGFSYASGFRGFIQTKAYVVQAADVTNGYLPIGTILGSSEAVFPIPIPGSGPKSYWQQTGRLGFLKIERWRASTGWQRLQEVAASGSVALGLVYWDAATKHIVANSGDLTAGDVWLVTYCTYASNAATFSTVSGITGDYTKVPTSSVNTTDAAAIPTRLTPITIAANGINRVQSLDMKITLKRERAEGVGEGDGLFSPSDVPEVTHSLDVMDSDWSLRGILENGTASGSDTGGSSSNDFFDPIQTLRNELYSSVALAVTLYDPRVASTIVKTVTSAHAFFNTDGVATPAKGQATIKYSGKDSLGNLSAAVTH